MLFCVSICARVYIVFLAKGHVKKTEIVSVLCYTCPKMFWNLFDKGMTTNYIFRMLPFTRKDSTERDTETQTRRRKKIEFAVFELALEHLSICQCKNEHNTTIMLEILPFFPISFYFYSLFFTINLRVWRERSFMVVLLLLSSF